MKRPTIIQEKGLEDVYLTKMREKWPFEKWFQVYEKNTPRIRQDERKWLYGYVSIIIALSYMDHATST